MAFLMKIAQNGIIYKLCSQTKNAPAYNIIKAVSISTSKKSKDTVTLSETPEQIKEKTEALTTKKNWVSYGFHPFDIVADRTYMHILFFGGVTICLVLVGFNIMYMPDNRMVGWTKREGFLELRRREAEGLPLIDKNYIPEENMELPTDEELGDIEIII